MVWRTVSRTAAKFARQLAEWELLNENSLPSVSEAALFGSRGDMTKVVATLGWFSAMHAFKCSASSTDLCGDGECEKLIV